MICYDEIIISNQIKNIFIPKFLLLYYSNQMKMIETIHDYCATHAKKLVIYPDMIYENLTILNIIL